MFGLAAAYMSGMSTQLRKGDVGKPGNRGEFTEFTLSPPEGTLGALDNPLWRREDVIAAAKASAAASNGHDAATVSLRTDQGTAASEATICVSCADPSLLGSLEESYANRDDVTAEWGDSTGNPEVSCVFCGAGVGSGLADRFAVLTEGVGSMDVAGYTFRAENMLPERVLRHLADEGVISERRYKAAVDGTGESAEEILDWWAQTRDVDRTDLHSFDSDSFPKPVFGHQLTVDDVDWLEPAA